MDLDCTIRELIRDLAREEVRAAIRVALPPLLQAGKLTNDRSGAGAEPDEAIPHAESGPRALPQQPPAFPGEDGLWNARQAAAFLGTSASWVYHRAAEASIPCVRLGHNLRFQPEALRAWVRGERGGGRVVAMKR